MTMKMKILEFALDPTTLDETEDQINTFLKYHDVVHVNTVKHRDSVYVFLFYRE